MENTPRKKEVKHKLNIKNICYIIFTIASLVCLLLPNFSFAQNKKFQAYVEENKIERPKIFYYTYNNLYVTTALAFIALVYIYIEHLKKKDVDNAMIYHNDRSALDAVEKRVKMTYLLLSHLTFAFNFILCGIFWPLYFYDAKMVKPKKSLEKGFETYVFVELCEHLLPMIYTLINMFYIVNIKNNMMNMHMRIFVYIYAFYNYMMFLTCRLIHHKYPYGFMNAMGDGMTILVCAGSALIGDGISIVTMYLTRKYYKSEEKINEEHIRAEESDIKKEDIQVYQMF